MTFTDVGKSIRRRVQTLPMSAKREGSVGTGDCLAQK